MNGSRSLARFITNALSLNILRSITGNLGRFIAIAGIVALGCGFYAGLRSTAPDMNLASDAYYDASRLMDIRIVSTMGLTDDDVQAVEALPDVEYVEAEYETDAVGTVQGEQYVFRIHSFPFEVDDNQASIKAGALNQITLEKGRFPSSPGECVISADSVMSTPVDLGDEISLTEGSQTLDDVLRTTTFRIVGFVHSPYYVGTTSLGSSTLGTGKITQFMYVSADDFVQTIPFTELFVRVKGADRIQSGSVEYTNLVQQTLQAIDTIAPRQERLRYDSLKAEAQEELDKNRKEFKQEKADAMRKIAEARKNLVDAKSKSDEAQAKLRKGQVDYQQGIESLRAERERAQAGFLQAEAELQQKAQALAAAGVPADVIAAQLAGAEAQISAQKAEAQARFAAAQAELDKAAEELSVGKSQLNSGLRKYNEGVEELEEQEASANEQFAQAEKKLNDAQEDINNLEFPEWLVMDRSKNPGVVSFESDATRVDNIAAFFPFIFFLVAALVALTSMTRMVEEDRGLIGTFKALGYSRSRITRKYLVYAAIASLIGALLGIVLLSLILPPVIMKAYAIIYYVPHPLIMPINVPIALLSACLGVGITLFATWAAAISTLRETPATLMRPRAPKEGKRILLERIGPLWRSLSFSWKVTFRNLFRYKKRLIMTVIGIAGCTGLLLTGLGLQNSINDIIDKQYGQTVLYNTVVSMSDSISADDEARAKDLLISESLNNEVMETYDMTIKAVSLDGKDYSATLVVPFDIEAFQRIWVMRTRVEQAPLNLGDEGAIITEKLATSLGVKPGDTIAIAKQDKMGNAASERYEVKLLGVMEHYVANYVFFSQGLYSKTFDSTPHPNSFYAVVGDNLNMRNKLSEELRSIPEVKTVSFNDEVINTYRTMLRSVNMIVIVLVIAAAALAFIVLYNLTNINITERQREIATLKVLGFTGHEVNMYIFRETMILTVLGALCGLIFGVFLEGFVVVSAEVEYVMFGRDIHLSSFVIAIFVTLAFAAFVMFCMRGKLRRINMVESLKSTE